MQRLKTLGSRWWRASDLKMKKDPQVKGFKRRGSGHDKSRRKREGNRAIAGLLDDVVADWADRMPLLNVYIFGDHAEARQRRPAN